MARSVSECQVSGNLTQFSMPKKWLRYWRVEEILRGAYKVKNDLDLKRNLREPQDLQESRPRAPLGGH